VLKKRLIATLTVYNDIVVQSIGFKKYLPVGKPAIAVDFLNQWGIDEIVIIDISATFNNREPNYDMYKRLSAKCYVPLTIGGGICSIDHVRKLLLSGADKVSINRAALLRPSLITEAANIFGNQCIVVSVDALPGQDGDFFVYDYFNSNITSTKVVNWVQEVEARGAGEIFINAVHKDGFYSDYDITLNTEISNAVNIPVIACGGAGKPMHFKNLFQNTGVHAAAAGNYFHFSEHSVITTKAFLKANGISVRLDTFAHYQDAVINERNRLEKKDDSFLEHLLYEKIEKEII
jgi:cyclase